MKKALALILAMLLCVSFFAACGNSKESEATPNEQSALDASVPTVSEPSTQEPSKSEPTRPDGPHFADNLLTANDCVIRITDYKVIQPGEEGNKFSDKPIIAFWYEVTNISGKEFSASTYWVALFDAYQDNNPNVVNKLEVGMSPADSDLLDEQNAIIKKDGTAHGVTAYELTDTETPVILRAGNAIGTEVYGEEIYTLK